MSSDGNDASMVGIHEGGSCAWRNAGRLSVQGTFGKKWTPVVGRAVTRIVWGQVIRCHRGTLPVLAAGSRGSRAGDGSP